jgi:hypothetical protein
MKKYPKSVRIFHASRRDRAPFSQSIAEELVVKVLEGHQDGVLVVQSALNVLHNLERVVVDFPWWAIKSIISMGMESHLVDEQIQVAS